MNPAISKFFRPTAGRIKWLLAVLAAIIVAVVMIYTNTLVEDLRKNEENLAALYAEYTELLLNLDDPSTAVIDFFQNNLLPQIHFPMILTDQNGAPQMPYVYGTENVVVDTSVYTTPEQQMAYLIELVRQFGSENEPIVMHDSNGEPVQRLYYSNSEQITRLQMFPLLQFSAISGFIFIGFVGFNYIRRTEQSNIWAGMAKEAAHQLGTPLSSLMAWIEILKYDCDKRDQVEQAAHEMRVDIERLNKIADRFSKIGSRPDREDQNISALVEKVSRYYELRLPRLGKRVEVIRDFSDDIHAEVNSVLFEWVIENLIKNAAESMEQAAGAITLQMVREPQRTVINVTDTGKGMSTALKRSVFKPGFTTKKRGWGLGLSLCKRIIEEYHKGRIYIRDSAPGKGTTFTIEIPTKEEG